MNFIPSPRNTRFPRRPLALTCWLCLCALCAGCGVSAKAEPDSRASGGDPPAAKGASRESAQPSGGGPELAVEDPADPSPFRVRVKAPSLEGGLGWINTSAPLRMDHLRGKFVILDFWTYCCINCIQLLPELKKLEQKYPTELVVIGVHSAKFDGEQETENIAAAVERYEIQHPVVNDAKHEIWDRFGVSAWPTMMVIDPEGYLVATHSGEIDVATLDEFFRAVMPYYQRRKLMDGKPLKLLNARRPPADSPLLFPGKVQAEEASRRLVISDSGHNRLVIADLDGKLLEVVGDGQVGSTDGDFATARFNHPQGTAIVGDKIYVADTENHQIRQIDLAKKQVRTVAGTGKQGHGVWPGIEQVRQDDVTGKLSLPDKWQAAPLKAKLASPWALAHHDGWLYIAMAGEHQIWRMSLDEKQIEVYAGDGREDIRDGKRVPASPPRLDPFNFDLGYASFAQPSGLATDGTWLYVADSEGSSVRAVPLAGDKEVHTVVGAADLPRGRSLFTFGDRDGEGAEVRLQHVLGVTWHKGMLYIADTYNNKIKTVDPAARTARTLVGGKAGRGDDPPQFDEPAGISSAAGRLYVADTNNHLVRSVEIAPPHKVHTLAIAGLTAPKPPTPAASDPFEDSTEQAVLEVVRSASEKKLRLHLKVELPPGWKTNPLGPMKYRVSAKGDSGPLAKADLGRIVAVAEDKRRVQLDIDVPLQATSGSAQLQVALAFYYCQEKTGLCKSSSIVWRVPLKISPDAASDPVPLEWKIIP